MHETYFTAIINEIAVARSRNVCGLWI